jgi:uncharacterized membrane protein
MDDIIVGHIILASAFIGLAVFFKKNPPKTINSWYGYRTHFSMKNQQVWEEANRYSNKAMFVVAGLLVLFQIISYIIVGAQQSFVMSSFFLAIASTLVIPVTYLRKIFDQNGNPK